METVCRVWQYVWASLNSVWGLFFLVVWPRQTTLQIVGGVIEIYGPATRRFLRRVIPLPQGAAALTIGHVVIACDPICLERTRAHERIHVWQYGRWGPFFLPLYGSASLIALAQGKNAYYGNWFEIEAHNRSKTCSEDLGMVGGGSRLPLAGEGKLLCDHVINKKQLPKYNADKYKHHDGEKGAHLQSKTLYKDIAAQQQNQYRKAR